MSHTQNDFKQFITHLRWEALSLAVLAVVLTYNSPYSLWVLPATFLLYDLCILGYAVSPRVGAFSYNLVHNLTIPTFSIAYGVYFSNDLVLIIGITWIFHIGVDRTLGYGLKHKHSFKSTHLGVIGKPDKRRN